MTINECKGNLALIKLILADNEQAEVIALTIDNAKAWLEELQDYRQRDSKKEYLDHYIDSVTQEMEKIREEIAYIKKELRR